LPVKAGWQGIKPSLDAFGDVATASAIKPFAHLITLIDAQGWQFDFARTDHLVVKPPQRGITDQTTEVVFCPLGYVWICQPRA
jgi:hypothetical protein